LTLKPDRNDSEALRRIGREEDRGFGLTPEPDRILPPGRLDEQK
jgi:hypothetical protein